MQIADFANSTGRLSVRPADGDHSTTIAHLAQFTEFEPRDAVKYDTAAHCIAADAIRNEWKHEITFCEGDYYDGFTAKFADGSALVFIASEGW